MAGKAEILYNVKAQRGGCCAARDGVRRRSSGCLRTTWKTPSIPKLIIYGGNGKCARNWESYRHCEESQGA